VKLILHIHYIFYNRINHTKLFSFIQKKNYFFISLSFPSLKVVLRCNISDIGLGALVFTSNALTQTKPAKFTKLYFQQEYHI